VEDQPKKADNIGSAGGAVVSGSGSGSSLIAGSDVGSAGSAQVGSDVGTVGSAGSAAVITPPAGPTVDTVIASSVPKATITVVDTGQSGTAPFTAKLEKDKAYKVRVEAPGYVKQELDVKGGQDKLTAKLVSKPHIVTVTSEPPGGMIAVDGVATGKKTPADVELGTAQAAKKAVHVQVRVPGYKVGDQLVDVSAMKDEDDKMTGQADLKLVVAPVVQTPPHDPTTHNTGSGSAAGSGGEGSAVTPPPSGEGSAASSSGGGGGEKPAGEKPAGDKPSGSAAGGGEPEPDWSKKQ
ncbi:MAG TPA: hypothetical protein VGC41_27090, partial [Kofleriaceae bacterium]